jgi:hypothetical protein
MFAAISLTSSTNFTPNPSQPADQQPQGAPAIAHSAMGVILKHSTSHNAVVCSFSHPIQKKCHSEPLPDPNLEVTDLIAFAFTIIYFSRF